MSTAYPDLPAAMVGWLRAQPTIVAAFGEDTSALATTKLWGDAAEPGVQLPWATYLETNKSTMYMTKSGTGGVAFIDDLAIQWIVVGNGKTATRQLGDMLAVALTDAPLLWQTGRLMMIRATGGSFVPNAGIAPESPNAYIYAVTFAAQSSGVTPPE